MTGFLISESEDVLTLSMPVDARRVAIGCGGFGIAFLCLTLLGAAGVWMEASTARDAGGPAGFFDPGQNHFGFLWLVALALLAGFVPFYVWRVSRSGVTLAFDRGEGVLRRNNAVVCRLVRIEFVRLAAVRRTQGQRCFRVSVFYDDGNELLVDESPDIDAVRPAAAAIADFLGVDLRVR